MNKADKTRFLQVIWTNKSRLNWKDFPLHKKGKAFALFERKPSGQIVVRGGETTFAGRKIPYEPSFRSINLEEPRDLWVYGTRKERQAKFDTWLKEVMEI